LLWQKKIQNEKQNNGPFGMFSQVLPDVKLKIILFHLTKVLSGKKIK